MLDIEKIIAIAIAAGKEILAIYQKNDFGAREKSDNSPLTEADIASHQVDYSTAAKVHP